MTTTTVPESVRPWSYGPATYSDAPECTLFTGCPGSAYHADSALSSGRLRRVAQTLAHAHRAPTSLEPTPALVRGELLHCLILRPGDFEREWLYLGSIDRRTKGGKATYEEAVEQASATGKRLLRDQDLDRPLDDLVRIAHEVRASSEFQALLGDGSSLLSEVSYWWTDAETGLRCRARADAIVLDPSGESALVLDLKTVQDASPRAVGNSLWYDCGDVQLVHYAAGLAQVIGHPAIDVAWLFVEANEVAAIAAHAMGPGEPVYTAAFARYRRLMHRWARATQTGEFPGWTAGAVAPVPLPAGAWEEIEAGSFGLGGVA